MKEYEKDLDARFEALLFTSDALADHLSDDMFSKWQSDAVPVLKEAFCIVSLPLIEKTRRKDTPEESEGNRRASRFINSNDEFCDRPQLAVLCLAHTFLNVANEKSIRGFHPPERPENYVDAKQINDFNLGIAIAAVGVLKSSGQLHTETFPA